MLLFARASWAAIAYVKDAAISSGSTCVTYTGSFTPTSAGDTWVAVCDGTGSTTNPIATGFSDNNSGTWTLQVQVGNSVANGVLTVATAPNHASGATTITVTDTAGSGNCGQSCIIFEFSGLNSGATGPTVDQNAQNTNAGSGSVWSAGTTGTLSQANELAIAGFSAFVNGSANATSSGPTNSFLQASSNNVQDAAGIRNALAATYKITAATTALSTQLTAAASVASSVSELVTLIPAAVATPTPTAACTPNAGIHLLNSSGKIMNGTASATSGSANWSAFAVDTTGFIVNAFTGTASGTSASANRTIQFVDAANHVCNGTSDSATAALAQATARVCTPTNQTINCSSQSATIAPYNYSVNIIDANGFIDNNY